MCSPLPYMLYGCNFEASTSKTTAGLSAGYVCKQPSRSEPLDAPGDQTTYRLTLVDSPSQFEVPCGWEF